MIPPGGNLAQIRSSCLNIKYLGIARRYIGLVMEYRARQATKPILAVYMCASYEQLALSEIY